MNLFGPSSTATFSPCRRYRYDLWRMWDEQNALSASRNLARRTRTPTACIFAARAPKRTRRNKTKNAPSTSPTMKPRAARSTPKIRRNSIYDERK